MIRKRMSGGSCQAGEPKTATTMPHEGEQGSELVEFSLVIIPLLAVALLTINIAWIYFAQESLQHAVQAGARFAVTGTVLQNFTGQDASIKSVVQQQAMGFLAGADGLGKITINYYGPSNLTQVVTGAGSNVGGNIIEIKVQGVSVSVLGPLLNGGPLALNLSAASRDVMESSPGGVPPTR